MIVVNFGGGKNSTAMLIEAVRRGERPDLILFADTGGEKPETYAHVERFSVWLVERGFPGITTVRAELPDGAKTLEEECAINGTLPSKAFGLSRCSSKWKIRPQEAFLRSLPEVQALWADGERVECWVGFHVGETSRIARQRKYDEQDPRYYHRHPLSEWDMDEDDCRRCIEESGLGAVPKSACFFCPSMKKREIRQLQREHPELLERALEMERRARPRLRGLPKPVVSEHYGDVPGVHAGMPLNRSVEGLGGYFSWEEYLRQPELPFGACEVGGGPELCDSCYDGE